jgi:hypothetical protein
VRREDLVPEPGTVEAVRDDGGVESREAVDERQVALQGAPPVTADSSAMLTP